MKTRPYVALALCLSLVSCERVGKLIDKAKQTISKDAETEADPLSEESEKVVPMDPQLAQLIDRTDEGILFRRDLPFPKDLSVTIFEREPMAARVFQQSEMGNQNTTVSTIFQKSMDIHRTPDSLRFSNIKEEFFDGKPVAGKVAPIPNKDHPLLPPVPQPDHVMVLRDGKWVASTRNFAEAALAQQLGPHVHLLLQEFGLGPRPMWFGKRRIAPGKPMAISRELLPMLLAGKATGELTITLEDVESVYGHPCGRFAIKGSYQRKDFPLTDGRLFDEETTIQSGHIWLSVLHPLVLKQRYEQIVTLSIAEGSGPAMRIQGNSSPTRTIQWNAGK